MSLFEWSTPDRQSVDRIQLPIIPNEIYFHIFDLIAPPHTAAEHLSEEQLKILSNLSCVCRFFANISLPRIYELIKFSGPAVPNAMDEYKATHSFVLSAQIDAGQPLALALAGVVRLCHFASWQMRDVGSPAGTLYTTAMSQMKNIREVRFVACSVDREHWIALAMLPLLEKLEFGECIFLHDPADIEPKIKIKVSQLHLFDCLASGRLIPVIEVWCLYTCLECYGDIAVANDEDPWSCQPHLTDLNIYVDQDNLSLGESYTWDLGLVLMQAPESLETLSFSVDVLVARGIARDILETMSECRQYWTNLHSLRSLTLQLEVDNKRSVTNELSQSVDGMNPPSY